jgi:hypothetical protein
MNKVSPTGKENERKVQSDVFIAKHKMSFSSTTSTDQNSVLETRNY